MELLWEQLINEIFSAKALKSGAIVGQVINLHARLDFS